MTVFAENKVARSSASVKKTLNSRSSLLGAHSSQTKTLLQHFNRSACFQIYMGILFHTKIEQWARMGIILITRAHGYIFLWDDIPTHI